jgi:Tol biopolymer transport system component/DNA-binding winged helix-turn-helix (wHTH) protein
MSLIYRGLFKFGAFVLNGDGMTLRKGEEPIALPPKAFATLLTLVQHRGEIVTKESLMSAVWPDAHVEEGNLTQSIFMLRRKLGQTPECGEYIQTLPKRGYRIAVPVEEITFEPAGAEPAPSLEQAAREPAPLTPRHRPLGMRLVAVVAVALVTAGVIWWQGANPSRVVSTYVELTHDATDKRGISQVLGISAAIETDGRRIFFTQGSQPATTLMQVSATGGETVPIPVPFAQPQLLDFSLSRSELLVGSFENPSSPGSLWAVPMPAGPPKRVGDLVVRDASWSPDGHEICFVRGAGLYRSKDDGTEVRKLADLPGIGWKPRWSPDGKVLRLTVANPKTSDQSIWEVSSDGKNLHPLLSRWNSPPNECCGRWTPDGRRFIFQATRQARTETWSLANSSIASPLFPSLVHPIQVTGGQMNSLSPTLSPDGRKLYVLGEHLRGELAKYDPRAGQFLPYLRGGSTDFVDFSPDGRWMTYVEFPQGTLWRSRMDGSEQLQLTFPPLEVMVPLFSPDGSRIVFIAIGAGRDSKIYVVSANGGTPVPVSDRGIEINPNWSPDGNSLLFSDAPFFSGNPASVAIHTLDLRTRQRATIPHSAGLFSPVWSPDGRYIAAVPQEGQRILLFDSRTQTWTELVKGWSFVKWSRDSQFLYYRRNGEDPAILRIRLADRKIEEVASLKGFRQGGRLAGLHFALAPDGSPVLLRDTGTQEIYSLDWDGR